MANSDVVDSVFERLAPHWRSVMDENADYVRLERIDQLNELGEAPLHVASRYGTCADVGALLALGADPNQRSEFGMAPLHYAYMGGNAEIVETLLNVGADPAARTRFGLLPGAGTTAEALRAEWEQCW